MLLQGVLTLATSYRKQKGDTVYVFPNAFGTWSAHVLFARPLSKDALTEQIAQLEVTVRALIIENLTRREVCWTHINDPSAKLALAKERLQLAAQELLFIDKKINAEGFVTAIDFCE